MQLPYATALRSINTDQRRNAVKELVQLRGAVPHSALPSLIILLEDVDDAVRDGAAEVLIHVARGDDAVLPALLDELTGMLCAENPLARMKAANLAGQIGPRARGLIPTLAEALRDKNIIFCRMAAQALTAIGPESIPTLEALANDIDAFVRREARWALGKLGVVPEALPLGDTINVHRAEAHPTVRVCITPRK